MEEDIGIKQEVIRLLAEEGGLQRIRELIGQDYAFKVVLKPSTIFNELLLPLFRVLTHQDIASSLVLELLLTTVFACLYGRRGERTQTMFQWSLDVLKGLQKDGDSKFDTYINIALQTLARIVDVNTTAQINPDLQALAESFGALLSETITSAAATSLEAHEATIALERIERRLGLGSKLSPATQGKTKIQPASFDLGRDSPGGRHDNDHASIEDIQILPTLEEISSDRPEYLPVTDETQNHLRGLEGLFDRAFRLFRQDSIGQLRDAVQAELGRLAPKVSGKRKQISAARVYAYQHVNLEALQHDKKKGFSVEVSFNQPVNIPDARERKDWWSRTKRLGPDALVCLLDTEGMALFCTVHPQTKPRDLTATQSKARDGLDRFQMLHSNGKRARLSLFLEDTSPRALKPIIHFFRLRHGKPRMVLVEFPGVLLPAIKPTLEVMQQLKVKPDIALAEYLVPQPELELSDHVDVRIPRYARRQGFRFNLKCLTDDGNDLFLTPGQPFPIQDLQNRSTLDNAQALAVQDALNRNLALIQGPPGTGKSYTGGAIVRVLLANKATSTNTSPADGANFGPILIVAYTNHALDQTLENLHKAGVKQIVRIGGGSKSEMLSECNLRHLARQVQRTKHENRQLAQSHEQDDMVKGTLEKTLERINRGGITSLVRYLRDNWPRWADAFFGPKGEDEDGFQVVGSQNPGKSCQKWVRSGRSQDGQPRTSENLLEADPNSLTRQERENMVLFLEAQYIEELESSLSRQVAQQKKIADGFQNITNDVDLRILRGANVIGITTSGLAKQVHLLRSVRCRVLICEEAGEILEAHSLTCFLPSVEHAILIGDHRQLRPSVKDYGLSSESHHGTQYSLDVSLFERLIHPPSGCFKLPYTTLEVQRRMHPSISRLIRETIYPALQDADEVSDYPQVVGVRERLFWVDHTQAEADGSLEKDHSTSHTNSYEVEWVTMLVQHLINQGTYEPDDIAVLTPYRGQLQLLKHELGKSMAIVLGELDEEQLDDVSEEGIATQTLEAAKSIQPTVRDRPVNKSTLLKALRIATVDNFQGEEAKVIILSLVRSNKEKKSGFLKTTNRINVALSRARHGMYIIGDAATAGQGSEMWAKVIEMLKEEGNFGEALALRCPRHPTTPILVSTPDNFRRFSPEGGCNLRCDKRMDCGHACLSPCHSDVLHAAFHCLEACPRQLKGCQHACPNVCGDPCPERCMVNVHDADRILPCNHAAPDLPCWLAQDLKLVKCPVKVDRIVPGCGHALRLPCHIDLNSPSFTCHAECGATLSCSHSCRKSCYRCTKREAKDENNPSKLTFATNHGTCEQVCGRSYNTCEHRCTSTCHEGKDCNSCHAPCGRGCSHSKCSRTCSEACSPCANAVCASQCPHSRCTVPCAAPCNNVPCSQRCAKLLSCRHQCPSMCGEACPDAKFCQICASNEIKDREADLIMFTKYRDIDLDATPCIFPPCQHFFTVETLDNQMEVKKFFVTDEDDKITDLKKDTGIPFSVDEIKVCAECRGSLRSINRYGRLVRRAMIDEATKRFIIWANKQHVPLAQELEDLKGVEFKTSEFARVAARGVDLTGNANRQFNHVNRVLRKDFLKLMQLRDKIFQYSKKASEEEQPFMKIWQLVANIRRRGGEATMEEDATMLQTRASLLADLLLVNCDLVYVSKVMQLRQKAPSGRHANPKAEPQLAEVDFAVNRKACLDLALRANSSQNVLQEAEAFVYVARYAVLERQAADNEEQRKTLFDEAEAALARVKVLRAEHASETQPIAAELEGVERMLRDGVFFEPVSNEEMRMVVKAMATELRGTGHWYRCVNGHPFTIGECGMAMEMARCPRCGESIGGQNHRAVEGVTRATDLEEALRDMSIRR